MISMILTIRRVGGHVSTRSCSKRTVSGGAKNALGRFLTPTAQAWSAWGWAVSRKWKKWNTTGSLRCGKPWFHYEKNLQMEGFPHLCYSTGGYILNDFSKVRTILSCRFSHRPTQWRPLTMIPRCCAWSLMIFHCSKCLLDDSESPDFIRFYEWPSNGIFCDSWFGGFWMMMTV